MPTHAPVFTGEAHHTAYTSGKITSIFHRIMHTPSVQDQQTMCVLQQITLQLSGFDVSSTVHWLLNVVVKIQLRWHLLLFTLATTYRHCVTFHRIVSWLHPLGSEIRNRHHVYYVLLSMFSMWLMWFYWCGWCHMPHPSQQEVTSGVPHAMYSRLVEHKY